MSILFFIAGLAILTLGAELLVRGSGQLAARLGIPPLIIGLTIVAFGTSAPEMAVSVSSALNNKADLALGNVVGSNTFNILFILGVSAIIVPLTISRQLIRIDMAVMLGAAMMALIMGLDGSISRIDGGMLFLGILLYTGLQVLLARREITQKDEPAEREGIQIPPLKRTPMGYLGDLALSLGGLVILVVGARLLVTGAVDIARSLGISELIIGLTIVAAGTSMPEVAASVMASIKGQRDIAVGNVVGSNVFNILAVLGMSALVSPNGVPVSSYALRLDIPAMVLVSALCIPVFLTGRQISRLEGWAFLGLYAAYTTTLILMAMGTIALPW